MMRTSNLFPLARRYSKQKARSRVQSTTNGGKLLTGFFFSVVGTQEEKRKSVMSQFFYLARIKRLKEVFVSSIMFFV